MFGLEGLINFGSQLLGGWADAEIQQEYNYQSMQDDHIWQEYMTDKMNAYNHPLQQRKRLEEAGINPMFMNGGNVNNVSASPASGSRMQPPEFKSGLREQMILNQQMAMQQQQMDIQRDSQIIARENLEMQKQLASSKQDNIDADTLLKFQNRLRSLEDTGMTADERFRKNALFNGSLEAQRLINENITKRNFALDVQNSLLPEKVQVELQKLKAEVEAVRAGTSNKNADTLLKQFELKLQKEAGLSMKDPAVYRLINKYIAPSETVSKFTKPISNSLKGIGYFLESF